MRIAVGIFAWWHDAEALPGMEPALKRRPPDIEGDVANQIRAGFRGHDSRIHQWHPDRRFRLAEIDFHAWYVRRPLHYFIQCILLLTHDCPFATAVTRRLHSILF